MHTVYMHTVLTVEELNISTNLNVFISSHLVLTYWHYCTLEFIVAAEQNSQCKYKVSVLLAEDRVDNFSWE